MDIEKRKYMKKKSFIIGLIVSIIALLIIIPIAVFTTKDLIEEKKLNDEVNDIIKLINETPINIDSLNKKYNNYVSKGNYLKVEKASKNYLKDVSTTFKETDDILDDKKITTLLSIENYRNDGKDFNNTLSYLSELKTKVKIVKSKLKDLSNNEKIMSYIKIYNLDSYYNKLYKNLVTDKSLDFNKSMDDYDKLVSDVENLIVFLKDNKSDWEIQDDKIAFKTNELIDKYNDLLNKID